MEGLAGDEKKAEPRPDMGELGDSGDRMESLTVGGL